MRLDDEYEVQEITTAKNPMNKYASVCDMYPIIGIDKWI